MIFKDAGTKKRQGGRKFQFQAHCSYFEQKPGRTVSHCRDTVAYLGYYGGDFTLATNAYSFM